MSNRGLSLIIVPGSGGSGGSGTVTSINLTAPSAFEVENGPISTAGVLNLIAVGTSNEYIDGTGSLQPFPIFFPYTANGLHIQAENNSEVTSPAVIELGGDLLRTTVITIGTNSNINTDELDITAWRADPTDPAPFFIGVNTFNGTGIFSVLTLQREFYSGDPDQGPIAGAGASLDFELGTINNAGAATLVYSSNRLISNWSTPLDTARTSQFEIWGVDSASDLFAQFIIKGTGQIQFPLYGLGTFLGSPSYILGIDSTGNIIEVGSSTLISANNGLAFSTATNIQWGGALVQNTTITGGAFQTLFTSTRSGTNITMFISNTGTGGGLLVTSIGNTAISAQSSNSIGIQGQSNSNVGIQGSSLTGLAGQFFVDPASTNTAVTVLQIQRFSQGTATNNIGALIEYTIQASDGNGYASNQLISRWSTATAGARVSQFEIWGESASVLNQLLTVKGSGQLLFNTYGSGTFAGTVTKLLGVDSGGNVIEVSTVGSLQHTIFIPTSGSTVNLVNNQYNIINPSGATLVALTANLPGSPNNNDVVYIKYVKAITTVTYTGGTLADSLISPAAGNIIMLVYDAGTGIWY